MLYTVIPLEHIYKNKENEMSCNKTDSEQIEFKNIALPNGSLTLKREDDHYIVDQIWSTDMKDYLNEDYFPGNTFKL